MTAAEMIAGNITREVVTIYNDMRKNQAFMPLQFKEKVYEKTLEILDKEHISMAKEIKAQRDAEKSREKERTLKLLDLVRSFPSLKTCDWHAVTEPPTDFDIILYLKHTTKNASSGQMAAAAFCLNVWDSTEHKFDLAKAMVVWDSAHRAAFVRWASDPFWF